MPGMTDRDHFAAAALTGLCSMPPMSGPDKPHDFAAMAYAYADAMLRERAKTNHDAAPAARAPEPEPEPAARRRPAGGTGDTDHGASPEARASVGRPRTDNADLPICAGTGDTPDSPQPIACSVFDRSQPIAKPTPVHTPPAHATPSVGSVPRDGTEPVAWGVANGSRVLATSISRMDAVDMQGDYAYHTEIVQLYRSPTLTDAEAETLRELRDEAAQYADEIGLCASEVRGRQRIIDGLLERLGGGK